MLFDKIGRKFYSPDEGEELHATGETIYSGDKPYLNTAVEPPLFTQFPPFNNIVLTPYLGMTMSSHSGGRTPPEGGLHE